MMGLGMCSLCGSSAIDRFKISHPFFRHLDFETIRQNGVLSGCGRCGLVENLLRGEDEKAMRDMFQSVAYSQCRFMKHTVATAAVDAPVSRTVLQAKLLRERIPIQNPAILEIGCFHGDLLRELNKCYESADLYGHDINDEFRSFFPQGENFHFCSDDLADVTERFHLVVLSGSIMYIKDIAGLMEQLKRLLLPEGVVFIHVVDISQNPYAILLGDQYYHYTPTIMRNVFAFHGFDFETMACEWFPKEFIGFAQASDNAVSCSMEKDDTILWCLATINEKIAQIRRLEGGFGVLGTTSAAAFVDSIADSKVFYFVDENPDRVGVQFRGKDVLHPKALRDRDAVIIPYGPVSRKIKQRFSSKYPGQFICL